MDHRLNCPYPRQCRLESEQGQTWEPEIVRTKELRTVGKLRHLGREANEKYGPLIA